MPTYAEFFINSYAGMMVYVTGQGLAYYTGAACVKAADGTTLIT